MNYEGDETKIIAEAEEMAAQIIARAEECAREIHGASLEYVDDMLVEVSLAAKRAKESVRIIMNQALEDLDRQIDRIEEHQKEILEELRGFTQNGDRPVKKAGYNIKVDERFIPKQSYEVKIRDSAEVKTEVHKPAKQPYEIKIADEWKDQIEKMLEESVLEIEQQIMEEKEKEEHEKEEHEPEEEGFSASDFDLDAEYFNWLEEGGNNQT